MKKIGIDARLYFQTGVGTYLQNLLFYLDKKNPKKELYYIYLRKADFPKVNFKSKNIVKKEANQKWHSLCEQVCFLIILLKDNLDLMHFTYFSYPILYWRKFIATVHDTTPLLFKTGKASTRNPFIYKLKHFFFKLVLNCQVRGAKAIISPTHTVKKELWEIFGAKVAEKIIPIYEGVNNKILNTKENTKLQNKYRDFFLYVGNFYPHKNVEKLVDAFGLVDKQYKLVLVGPDDFFFARMKDYVENSKAKDRIVLIKSPPDSDLVFFYRNAQAIIQPSLSEGFGLPLVEAAYFGTRIIASNIKVFDELWKDQYISFDPKSTQDISNKINIYINNKYTVKYTQLLKNYSFKKMTEETVRLYLSNI